MIVDNYDKLVAIAKSGRQYRSDEVWTEPSDQLAEMYGAGFDFLEQIPVPDIVDGRTVTATAALRIIASYGGTLLLRSRLTWTPSDGHAHQSYAHYMVTRAAAKELAKKAHSSDGKADAEMSEEEAWNVLFEAFNTADTCSAEWVQTYPQFDVDSAVAERHAEYHKRVIVTLAEAGTAMTCMLSYMDIGEVRPEEITQIYEWVKSQL